MIPSPRLADELGRLVELHDTCLLDTPPEAGFDDLVSLAAFVFEAPIALVSLVDEERQWFKAALGLGVRETPRSISFCGHAIARPATPLVVPDTLEDPRFVDNPLVVGDPGIRFYVGMPLVTAQGHALGTLCVLDRVPRSPTPAQLHALAALARRTVELIELRNRTRELERARLRLDAFFENTNDLIHCLDEQGRLTFANRAWREALGYPAADLVGLNLFDVIEPECHERARACLVHAQAGEPVALVEVALRSRDGRRVIVEGHALREDSERGEPLVRCILRDITRRRANEARLEEFARKLDEAQALAGLGSCHFDRRTGAATWSGSSLRMFGYDADASPTRDEALTRIHPDDQARVAKAAAEGWRTGTGFQIDTGVLLPDGRTIDVELRTTYEVDAVGLPVAVNATMQDVTRRMDVERLKTEFVSMVSHELRTPLTSIRGALGLVDAGLAGELPKEAADMVRVAHNNAERLIRLVNDILDLDKMAAGRLELRVTNLDLRRLMSSAADAIRPLAAARDIQVVVENRARGAVRGDADRLAQVLANLLSNAIKYSPDGGRVILRAVPGASAGRIRIAIRDHGPGIPADRRHLLFGKFQQLDASDTRARGGSGLGLAISKSIIEQHGGEIGADSEPGTGSEFWFELPGRQSGSELDMLSSGRQVVALVGGDDVLLSRAEVTLTGAGFVVAVAHDLELAEAYVRRFSPAAVLVCGPASEEGAATTRLAPLMGGRPVFSIGGLAPEQLPALVRGALRPPGRTRVLVVDDDDSSLRLIATQLEPLQTELRTAGDGLTAVALAREFVPDLIVLDLDLPGADGFQVVDVLRQGSLRTTALLVYTVRDLTSTDRRALSLGQTRHLTKTRTTSAELLTAASELLGGVASPARSSR